MISRILKSTCFVIFIAIIMLASGVSAQAPGESSGDQQGQAPASQERSKPKEFGKVFCPESSTAQVNLMVMATNCADMCANVYQEYPCELQQRLNDGWKVTSVATVTISVNRDPCQCGVTGIESVLER
jgi:cytochrome oxidase Cu insertion factor (SCO1/SenC/PrrC family)